MENFKVYNPTKLHFGKDVVSKSGKILSSFGHRVLLIYGRGSVKKNGIYQTVISELKSSGCEIFEYGGIKSNPVFEDVDAAAALARESKVDVIIALGGGSVIDTAKMVALTACVTHSSWDFFTHKKEVKKALPLMCILTLAATGTEMNPYAVIQNDVTHEKRSYGHPLIFPKHSFLDPAFTLSVPYDYTAYGICDVIAHALEAYFGKGRADLTDNIIIEIVKETMHKGKLLLSNLQNYDLRADIMLAATLALNGTTTYGKSYGDWGVHSIGHVLSSLYDIPHGASLSIAYPAWLRLHKEKLSDKILFLGEKLMNAANVEETIEKLEQFFRTIKCPVSLNEIPQKTRKSEVLQQLQRQKVNGYYHKITDNDYVTLADLMYAGHIN